MSINKLKNIGNSKVYTNTTCSKSVTLLNDDSLVDFQENKGLIYGTIINEITPVSGAKGSLSEPWTDNNNTIYYPTDLTNITITVTPKEYIFNTQIVPEITINAPNQTTLTHPYGANVNLEASEDLSTVAQKDEFVQGLKNIIDEYKFDGIDLDFEGGSMNFGAGALTDFSFTRISAFPKLKNEIDAFKELKTHYGPSLRGVMTWSINWDTAANCTAAYEFSTNCFNYFNSTASVLEAVKQGKAHIYPNPFEHSIRIKSPHTITEITIFDIKGKKLYQKLKPHNSSIDLSLLESSLYLMELKKESSVFIKSPLKSNPQTLQNENFFHLFSSIII